MDSYDVHVHLIQFQLYRYQVRPFGVHFGYSYYGRVIRYTYVALPIMHFAACQKGVGMIRVDFGPISETVYIDIILNTIIESWLI
jgi:hypothetical protein